MEREQLEKMKLEALRMLAHEQGIEGAGQMGRAQLIDRLEAPRHHGGILERAREAVAHAAHRVEEKAHELADKLRGEHAHEEAEPPAAHADGEAPVHPRPQRANFDVPSSTARPHAGELETVTMARRYLAEGQKERALEIFEKLLKAEPDDEAIVAQVTALREELGERRPEPVPAPAAAPTHAGEPLWMLDLEELPETYGIDECEVLYKDPFWVFAYWEVTEQGLSGARAQLGPSADSARLVLRLFTTVAQPAGVERHIQDIDLTWNHGRRYMPSPKPGAHLRVAVGLLSREGYFAPIAHSSLIRVPAAEPAPPGPVEWMEVLAGRSRGRDRESLVIVRRGAEHRERGVPGGASGSYEPPLGASETRSRGGRWPGAGGSGSGSGSGGLA